MVVTARRFVAEALLQQIHARVARKARELALVSKEASVLVCRETRMKRNIVITVIFIEIRCWHFFFFFNEIKLNYFKMKMREKGDGNLNERTRFNHLKASK